MQHLLDAFHFLISTHASSTSSSRKPATLSVWEDSSLLLHSSAPLPPSIPTTKCFKAIVHFPNGYLLALLNAEALDLLGQVYCLPHGPVTDKFIFGGETHLTKLFLENITLFCGPIECVSPSQMDAFPLKTEPAIPITSSTSPTSSISTTSASSSLASSSNPPSLPGKTSQRKKKQKRKRRKAQIKKTKNKKNTEKNKATKKKEHEITEMSDESGDEERGDDLDQNGDGSSDEGEIEENTGNGNENYEGNTTKVTTCKSDDKKTTNESPQKIEADNTTIVPKISTQNNLREMNEEVAKKDNIIKSQNNNNSSSSANIAGSKDIEDDFPPMYAPVLEQADRSIHFDFRTAHRILASWRAMLRAGTIRNPINQMDTEKFLQVTVESLKSFSKNHVSSNAWKKGIEYPVNWFIFYLWESLLQACKSHPVISLVIPPMLESLNLCLHSSVAPPHDLRAFYPAIVFAVDYLAHHDCPDLSYKNKLGLAQAVIKIYSKLKDSIRAEECRVILNFIENVGGKWGLAYEIMFQEIIHRFSEFLPSATVRHIAVANFAQCPLKDRIMALVELVSCLDRRQITLGATEENTLIALLAELFEDLRTRGWERARATVAETLRTLAVLRREGKNQKRTTDHGLQFFVNAFVSEVLVPLIGSIRAEPNGAFVKEFGDIVRITVLWGIDPTCLADSLSSLPVVTNLTERTQKDCLKIVCGVLDPNDWGLKWLCLVEQFANFSGKDSRTTKGDNSRLQILTWGGWFAQNFRGRVPQVVNYCSEYLKRLDHGAFFGALSSGFILDTPFMEIYEKQALERVQGEYPEFLFQMLQEYRHTTWSAAALFAKLHASNLRMFAKSSPNLRDVLQQPLWKNYFVLCSSWNIDLTSPPAQVKTGLSDWAEVREYVLPAATQVMRTLESIAHKSLTIEEFEFVENQHDTLFCLAEALGGQAMRDVRLAFEESRSLIKDFYTNKIRLVESFLQHWVPNSVKWDLSVLEAFVTRSAKRSILTVKDMLAEVRKLFYPNVQEILECLDQVKNSQVLSKIWALSLSDKNTFDTILTMFRTFLNNVSNFTTKLHKRTITLNDVEKYFQSVVVGGSGNVRERLSGECSDLSRICPTSTPLEDCVEDIVSYFEFSASEHVISDLLLCAKELSLTLDKQFHTLEQLQAEKSNAQIHTLQDFMRRSAITKQNIGGISSLPSPSLHTHNFLLELALCGDLADWIAGFLKDEDLRHEVDILKSKIMGDNKQLVTLLGDLDAIRTWFFQLGIAARAKNGMRQTTFSEFLIRVSNSDAEWAKRATAHAQLESVRLHVNDIKSAIQELRSGQLSQGSTALAAQILLECVFVFRTVRSMSPFTAQATAFEVRVCGKKEMSFEAYRELAKKLILANQSPDISKFLEVFDQVQTLTRLLEHIHSVFQFNYQDFRIEIKCNQLAKIKEGIHEIQFLITQWTLLVESARKSYSSLNFLTKRDMCVLVNLFDKDGSLAVAQQIMSKLGCKHSLSFQIWRECVRKAEALVSRPSHLAPPSTTAAPVSTSPVPHTGKPRTFDPVNKTPLDLEVTLTTLGIFCQKHFFLDTQSARICDLAFFETSHAQFAHWLGVKILYPAGDESKAWTFGVLSLYLIHYQRLPYYHELLLCCAETTQEEFDLLLHRIENSTTTGNPTETYSVVFPEQLPPPLQIQLSKFLQRRHSTSFTLAVFVSSSCSPFFAMSPTLALLFPSLPPSYLQDALEKHLSQNKIRAEVFVSEVAGAGKTRAIAAELRANFAVRALYTSTDFAQLIYELNTANCTGVHLIIPSPTSFSSHPTLVHWSDIERFLFRIFALGIVEDQYHNIFYTKFDSRFLIEVSNSYSENLQLGTTFLSILPQHCVTIPKKIQLTPDKLKPIQEIFGVGSYSGLFPSSIQHHPINASNAVQFLSMSSSLLQNSPGFTKRADTVKRSTWKQLLDFATTYLLTSEKKQIHLNNQPIITFGLDKASKYRVISTCTDEVSHTLSLPHYPLLNKSLLDLQTFLQILFPKGFSVDPRFVLTSDNTFKLALLKTLISCEIPVIFMGETGSGKTKLIEYFGKVHAVPVFTLDLHGGIGEHEIIEFINRAQHSHNGKDPAILFFDEINTSPAGELIKELVCDRSCRGVSLAKNFQVLAACNPYVELAHESLVLPATSQPTLATNAHTRTLKYTVRPLHATLEKYVWDFGKISDQTEMEYIRAIVAEVSAPWKSPRATHITAALPSVISSAQQFSRAQRENSGIPVSLRDVERCVKLCGWFLSIAEKNKSPFSLAQFGTDKVALTTSLFVTYSFRFASRAIYKDFVTHVCASTAGYLEPCQFTAILQACTLSFIKCFHLGPAISPNALLSENLLFAFCCCLNKIPLLMIGRPGTSKTLSMSLLIENMRGSRSHSEFLAQLPRLQPFSVQCSAHTTSATISACWEEACQFQRRAGEDTIAVAILDEIGLAQHSPNVPLKVLHSLLAESPPPVAFVGLSNWALDASNMNRTICRICPIPTTKELAETASHIAGKQGTSLDTILQSSAAIFEDICNSPSFSNFYGLRDFYSFIKQLDLMGSSRSHRVMYAVEREFGGSRDKDRQELDRKWAPLGVSKLIRSTELELIRDNLAHPNTSRHLMVISQNQVGNHILFGIKQAGEPQESSLSIPLRHKVEILEGSLFEDDCKDQHVHVLLHRIRRAMEEGVVLVIIGLEILYESLYDVLNKNYTQVGTQLYTRIAIGRHSESCVVNHNFKVVVVVDPLDAYHRLAPPFLNRFEKHRLDWTDVLPLKAKEIVAKVMAWLHAICEDVNGNAAPHSLPFSLQSLFYGYHWQYVPSCVAARIQGSPMASLPEHAIVSHCKQDLMRMLRPDGALKVMRIVARSQLLPTPSAKANKSCNPPNYLLVPLIEDYLASYCYSSLLDFVQKTKTASAELRLVVYSPTPTVGASTMNEICAHMGSPAFASVNLAAYSAQLQLMEDIEDFWRGTKDMLFIECPPDKGTFKHVAHVVRLCDQIAAHSLTRKHVIITCASRGNPTLGPLSADFIPNWVSSFIANITEGTLRGFTYSLTPSFDSLSKLLRMNSWVDVIASPTVDIFGAIESTIGNLGFASMLNYANPPQMKEVSDAIYSMLKDPMFRTILESKVRLLLEEVRKNGEPSWLDECLGSDSVSVSNAFDAYICRKIARLFVWLLAKIGTNHNLATFPTLNSSTSDERKKLWAHALTHWQPMYVLDWDKDSHSLVFASTISFPFSFMFLQQFQKLETEAKNLAKRRNCSLSEALQSLMHNKFPVLNEIHHADLLRSYAHDLASYVSTTDWRDCFKIITSYLSAHYASWHHVADVHVSWWEGRQLLLPLCALAKCSARMRAAIEGALARTSTFEESVLLLEIVPACLQLVTKMTDGVSGRHGTTYKRAANAFLIIHKLLLRIPTDLLPPVILRGFLEEQIMFHFHFDYVYLHRANDSISHQFRKEVIAKFPCSFIQFLQFASTLDNFPISTFMYKYAGLYAVPLALLLGTGNVGCRKVIRECLQYALAFQVDLFPPYLSRMLLNYILDDESNQAWVLNKLEELMSETRRNLAFDNAGFSLIADYFMEEFSRDCSLYQLYHKALSAAQDMASTGGSLSLLSKVKNISVLKKFVLDSVLSGNEELLNFLSEVLIQPEFHFQRGLRIYMLKLIYRQYGEANLKAFLRDHREKFTWVITDLHMELAEKNLPNLPDNDFGFLYGVEYSSARQKIDACELDPRNVNALVLQSHVQKIAFSVAFYHKVLCILLVENEATHEKIQPLLRMLDLVSEKLPVRIAQLLRALCENSETSEYHVSPATALTRVSTLILSVHIFCVVVVSPHQSFLIELCENPSVKLNCRYFPSMPDNMFQVLAGLQGGMGVTQFYVCPCGEPFGIGNCGQPMQLWRCVQCGRQIGGQNHAMVDPTIGAMQNFTHRNMGYDDHLNEVPSQTYRHLDSPSLRILRVIMHGCLFWTRSLNIDTQYTRHTPEFLIRQMENNLTILGQNLQQNEEITFELLECLTHNIGRNMASVFPNSNFLTEDQRSGWERNMCSFIREQREKELPKLRAEVLRRIDADNGAQSSIMDEIRGGEFEYTIKQKNENIPLLLSCDPVANDLAHFKRFLANTPEYAEKFPVLSILLSMTEEINIVRKLPHVTQFVHKMAYILGGRMTVQEAQTTTIRQTIAGLELEDLFFLVEEVWNFARVNVQRFECEAVEIPTISLESPIVMVLHHPEHAKIFAEVIKSVISLQNNALQRIFDALMQLPPEARPAFVVLLPTRDADPIDVSVAFSETVEEENVYLLGSEHMEDELDNLLRSTYYPFDKNAIAWPLDYIHSFCIKEYVIGRPYFSANTLPVCSFVEGTNNKVISKQELSLVVEQRELHHDKEEHILANLENEDVCVWALSQLQAAIAYVKRVGGHPDTNLLHLMQDLMLMKVRAPAVFQSCNLSNLFALQKMLLDRIKPDVLAAVQNEYKAPLDDQLLFELQAIARVNFQLLQATIQEFIQTMLTGSSDNPINPTLPLKFWLAEVPPLVDDEQEAEKVSQVFPDSILVRHSCALLGWVKARTNVN